MIIIITMMIIIIIVIIIIIIIISSRRNSSQTWDRVSCNSYTAAGTRVTRRIALVETRIQPPELRLEFRVPAAEYELWLTPSSS